MWRRGVIARKAEDIKLAGKAILLNGHRAEASFRLCALLGWIHPSIQNELRSSLLRNWALMYADRASTQH